VVSDFSSRHKKTPFGGAQNDDLPTKTYIMCFTNLSSCRFCSRIIHRSLARKTVPGPGYPKKNARLPGLRVTGPFFPRAPGNRAGPGTGPGRAPGRAPWTRAPRAGSPGSLGARAGPGTGQAARASPGNPGQPSRANPGNPGNWAWPGNNSQGKMSTDPCLGMARADTTILFK
jgi:hypothetical protein